MHHVTTWQRKNKQLLVIDFKALFEVFLFASVLLFIQQETVPLFFPLKMTCVRSLCTLIHYSNTLHTRPLHLHAVEGLSFLYDIRASSKVSSYYRGIPGKKRSANNEPKHNTIEDCVQLRHNTNVQIKTPKIWWTTENPFLSGATQIKAVLHFCKVLYCCHTRFCWFINIPCLIKAGNKEKQYRKTVSLSF